MYVPGCLFGTWNIGKETQAFGCAKGPGSASVLWRSGAFPLMTFKSPSINNMCIAVSIMISKEEKVSSNIAFRARGDG